MAHRSISGEGFERRLALIDARKDSHEPSRAAGQRKDRRGVLVSGRQIVDEPANAAGSRANGGALLAPCDRADQGSGTSAAADDEGVLSHDRFSVCALIGSCSTTEGDRAISLRVARSLTSTGCRPFSSCRYTPCGSSWLRRNHQLRLRPSASVTGTTVPLEGSVRRRHRSGVRAGNPIALLDVLWAQSPAHRVRRPMRTSHRSTRPTALAEVTNDVPRMIEILVPRSHASAAASFGRAIRKNCAITLCCRESSDPGRKPKSVIERGPKLLVCSRF